MPVIPAMDMNVPIYSTTHLLGVKPRSTSSRLELMESGIKIDSLDREIGQALDLHSGPSRMNVSKPCMDRIDPSLKEE